MNKYLPLAVVLAMGAALPAFAQNTVLGIDALDDQIDDITIATERDLNRGNDDQRFGENDVVQGIRGSAALTASGSNGNEDSGDLSFAGRLTYGTGSWNHLFGFAGEYGESDGVSDEESVFVIYEASRYFSPVFYAFGTGRYDYDGIEANEHDLFVGGGLGYRFVNTQQFAWRLQAGPGVRYTKKQDGGDDSTDFAGIASSRFFYGLTDQVSVTNDTDVLYSDADTTVANDFGVNFKVNDTFSTRISYRTDYVSDPGDGIKNTDNTIGVSLVVGF